MWAAIVAVALVVDPDSEHPTGGTAPSGWWSESDAERALARTPGRPIDNCWGKGRRLVSDGRSYYRQFRCVYGHAGDFVTARLYVEHGRVSVVPEEPGESGAG